MHRVTQARSAASDSASGSRPVQGKRLSYGALLAAVGIRSEAALISLGLDGAPAVAGHGMGPYAEVDGQPYPGVQRHVTFSEL
jgi:hypothetical protein